MVIKMFRHRCHHTVFNATWGQQGKGLKIHVYIHRKSMHGAALKRPWKGDSATCSDCHSSHRINDVKKLPAHRIITEGCGGCHKDELNGYMASPHGQLAWHGAEDAPKCVDCHDSHAITHVDNANSPVNKKNLIDIDPLKTGGLQALLTNVETPLE